MDAKKLQKKLRKALARGRHAQVATCLIRLHEECLGGDVKSLRAEATAFLSTQTARAARWDSDVYGMQPRSRSRQVEQEKTTSLVESCLTPQDA